MLPLNDNLAINEPLNAKSSTDSIKLLSNNTSPAFMLMEYDLRIVNLFDSKSTMSIISFFLPLEITDGTSVNPHCFM